MNDGYKVTSCVENLSDGEIRALLDAPLYAILDFMDFTGRKGLKAAIGVGRSGRDGIKVWKISITEDAEYKVPEDCTPHPDGCGRSD